MPYVHRSSNGEIDSLHRSPALDASEFIDGTDPDLQRFLSEQASPSGFGRLDADFVRVLEDLIDALLHNGTLRITDLPVAVQAKLVVRKDWRDRSSGLIAPSGFAASGFVEVIDDSAFGDLATLRPSAE
jgi:hypothetical protein